MSPISNSGGHAAFEADFSSYFEDDLAPERAVEVRTHLEECSECRARYDDFVESVGALSGMIRTVPAIERVVGPPVVHGSTRGWVPLALVSLLLGALGVGLVLVVRLNS